MKSLVHLGQLERDALLDLIARAGELRAGAAAERFPGRALGLLFLASSLRTQASFQRAAGLLGLDLVQLSGIWQLEADDDVVMDGERAEHVREAARVLSRYVDVLAVRAFAGMRDLAQDLRDPVLHAFAHHAEVPVVSMESAQWHPCQALADAATLDQHHVPSSGKFVLTWAWHPRALPHAVANSTLCMAARRGMQVVLLRPEGYDLPQHALDAARDAARASGGSLEITDDRSSALQGAQVVYAKSWGSLEHWGDPAAESARRAPLRDWCVRPEWLSPAPRSSSALFMHCLPVRRGVVVDPAVLDGPHSAVIDQAENRLWAQTALLEAILADVARGSEPARPTPTSALHEGPPR